VVRQKHRVKTFKKKTQGHWLILVTRVCLIGIFADVSSGMPLPMAQVEESWQMAEFYSNKVCAPFDDLSIIGRHGSGVGSQRR